MKKLLVLVCLVSLASTSAFGLFDRRGYSAPKCTETCDPEPYCKKMVEVKTKACPVKSCHTTWVCPDGYAEETAE